jgi:hypothetical protein
MSQTTGSIRSRATYAILTVALLLTFPVDPAAAQRPQPKAYATFQGDTMYTVLPPNTIPAIFEPEFLSGKKADSQMSPGEPVIGIVLGGEARAYSMWQLDAHEIVNDTIDGKPIAVTW